MSSELFGEELDDGLAGLDVAAAAGEPVTLVVEDEVSGGGAFGTRGSFDPWMTRTGVVIWLA